MNTQAAYEMATRDGLAKKLYDYLGFEYSEWSVSCDLEYDYLTINDGRDGKTYLVYVDETHCAAIRVDDGEIVKEDECEDLFF